MAIFFFSFCFLVQLCIFDFAGIDAYPIGVNYGMLGNDLLPPSDAVPLIKNKGFGSFKLFDANSNALIAASNSGLKVSIMVPNEDIPSVANSQANANAWVQSKILPYYQSVEFKWLMVGNEILSDNSIESSTWPKLVPAMKNLHSSLEKYSLDYIKVTTTLASDAISNSYPPSSGSFRSDISSTVISPMLQFLHSTGSAYCANVYPYFAWAADPSEISLDYALFGSSAVVVQDGSYGYTNLLDAMVDAIRAAMEKLGYGGVQLVITETGWPNSGGYGATASNAQLYNNRLISKTLAKRGTPRQPNKLIETYIFALFNENQKGGAATERYWGVCYPDGNPVYSLDTSGGGSGGEQWCLASSQASEQDLQNALDYACGNGADCSAIQPGASCYYPNTVFYHASYAFNSYWQQTKNGGGSCYFNGAALISTSNPSTSNCIYPSS